MTLDRAGGGQLDQIIQAAIRRSRASAEDARGLLDAQLPGPAYVWAVRSVEIYVKEVMLLPLFLAKSDGDWDGSWRRVRETFRSGKWNRALRTIDESYGPLATMTTDDDRDVWDVWKSVVTNYRGEIVHGFRDPTIPEAEIVVAWANQMIGQLSMRLIAAGKHPLADLFKGALQEAQKSLRPTDPDATPA
jgi:hypothetical protein